MPLALFYFLYFLFFLFGQISLFNIRIELHLCSVLKYFCATLQPTWNSSEHQFINSYCRISKSVHFQMKSPSLSRVCFLGERDQVLILLHNETNMAMKSSYSISQPILLPFLFTMGGKIIQVLNFLNKASFHWKQIGSLLPGRAQVGPVTWEWLGEHAFCSLFFQSENTSLACKK